MHREKPHLGAVQETLLIPLYARAVENRKEHALLRDTRAEEIVASIDYDFGRFDELPSLTGALLRTRLFDRWVAESLSAHPGGTVVELGAGLNTRHERVDNGRARWFELDLPDVIGLREKFFTDSPRRTMIAASVTEETWTAEVAPHSSEPYLFVAEAVLPYPHEPEVRQVFGLLADRFPGSPSVRAGGPRRTVATTPTAWSSARTTRSPGATSTSARNADTIPSPPNRPGPPTEGHPQEARSPPRIRPRRLPRPCRRLRVPHPLHHDQRQDDRLGGRQHVSGCRRRDLERQPLFCTRTARVLDTAGRVERFERRYGRRAAQ